MSAMNDLMRQRAISAAEFAVLAANRPTPDGGPDYIEVHAVPNGTWRVSVRHNMAPGSYREALVRTAAAIVRYIEQYDEGDF